MPTPVVNNKGRSVCLVTRFYCSRLKTEPLLNCSCTTYNILLHFYLL
uniref:Uncharacterized protein n=1 Tax=Anguilla anguilla TaxID=7936 RepID=A0A0E9STZ1_ANGAN